MPTADESPSSSYAITTTAANSTESSTKTSVRKAIKTNAKAPPAGKDKTVRRSWKNPKNKPKRPLSAYNLFFQAERQKLVGGRDSADAATKHTTGNTKRRRRGEAHGKIGFSDLAKQISVKWKNIDSASRTALEARADMERARYEREVEEWKRSKEQKHILQKAASMLQEGACSTDDAQSQQKLQQELLEATLPTQTIDMNAILSNLMMQRAANIRTSLALREATTVLNAYSVHAAVSGCFSAMPTDLGKRNKASFQMHNDNDEEFECITRTTQDTGDFDNAAPTFCSSLQNDLRQLDELDAMLKNFDSEDGADNLFHLDENDTFCLQPMERLSRPTTTSASNDPFSLDNFVDEDLDCFNPIDEKLAALWD